MVLQRYASPTSPLPESRILRGSFLTRASRCRETGSALSLFQADLHTNSSGLEYGTFDRCGEPPAGRIILGSSNYLLQRLLRPQAHSVPVTDCSQAYEGLDTKTRACWMTTTKDAAAY